MVALEGLENLLKVGEKDSKENGTNEYVLLIEEHRGVDYIEQLQNHPNNEIYDKAVNILETYFAAEEEDQNTAPVVNTTTQHFSFDTVDGGPSTFHF